MSAYETAIIRKKKLDLSVSRSFWCQFCKKIKEIMAKKNRSTHGHKLAPFPGCVYKIAPPTTRCMSPHILAPPVLHMQMKCRCILTFWKNYVFNDEQGNLAISLDLYFSYTFWVGAVVIVKMSWGTELWVSGQSLTARLILSQLASWL